MSGPAIVALLITVTFGLITLVWGAAHAIEVRAIAKKGGRSWLAYGSASMMMR